MLNIMCETVRLGGEEKLADLWLCWDSGGNLNGLLLFKLLAVLCSELERLETAIFLPGFSVTSGSWLISDSLTYEMKGLDCSHFLYSDELSVLFACERQVEKFINRHRVYVWKR